MFRPMISLTHSVTVFDEHTRLANLETGSPRNAALGTAKIRRI